MAASSAARCGKLVLGLGNPGEGYARTRHNLGFRVVEALASRRRLTIEAGECHCRIAEDASLVVAAPQTFMNRSGHAARCLVERRGFAPSEVLVVIDDVALPVGRLRLRPGGGAGGHRGLESVLESLHTAEVPRLRLGIREGDAAPPGGDEMVDYVLTPFPLELHEAVAAMVERAADACEAWAHDGIEQAMNRFNG